MNKTEKRLRHMTFNDIVKHVKALEKKIADKHLFISAESDRVYKQYLKVRQLYIRNNEITRQKTQKAIWFIVNNDKEQAIDLLKEILYKGINQEGN